MGLILDLAVVALALLVIGSLALLSWTLAVSAVRAVGHGQARIAVSRRSIADAEGRFRSTAGQVGAGLSELAARTRISSIGKSSSPGERHDT